MRRWFDSAAVAAAFFIVGSVVIGFASIRASVDEHRSMAGEFAHAEVVAVTEGAVVVAYERGGQDLIATAYPVEPGQFSRGEDLTVRFLPEEPAHVVIEGVEENRTDHHWSRVTGALLLITGLALFVSRRATLTGGESVGAVTWVGRRHGA